MKFLISLILLAAVTLLAAEPKKQYRITCPKCQTVVYAIPYHVSTNGGRAVEGGTMIERTLHFKCPLEDKKPTVITARHEAFVAESKATEILNPPLPLPLLPGPVTAWKK